MDSGCVELKFSDGNTITLTKKLLNEREKEQ